MLYFTEYQIIKLFSAMLCQNVVPQNKVMKLGKKKAAIEILVVCLDYTYFFISN